MAKWCRAEKKQNGIDESKNKMALTREKKQNGVGMSKKKWR